MAEKHKALQYKTLQHEALQHTSAGKGLKLQYPANRRSSGGPKVLCCLLATTMTVAGIPGLSVLAADNGWEKEDGRRYWYEDGVKQGTEGRGKEIYDPDSDAWYWLDAVQGGALTTNKDVYQESLAGDWGDTVNAQGQRIGKWVRYDENGHMVKGWNTNDNGTYYFDTTYGTMAKGTVTIDGKQYTFDENSGILQSAPVTDGWATEDGVSYWYENGVKQGTEGRGKEIYDPDSDAWYWLDAIQGGALTRNKDVYQESLAGDWGDTTNAQGERIGKWVRYDENGHMVKGWNTNDNGTYYFDLTYGTMAKGMVQIEGKTYLFDSATGVLQEAKYSGEWKGLDWKITDSGKLMVSGNLTEQVNWLAAPWKAYDGETETVYMDFTGATSLEGLFYLGTQKNQYGYAVDVMSNIKEIDIRNLDTSQVTNMKLMFYGCKNLVNLDLSGFDTSHVTDMHAMFTYCLSLKNLDLSSFNTSQVTDMGWMFTYCQKLESLDLSNFDTRKVTTMGDMFASCIKLENLNLSSFDTSRVTNIGYTFAMCDSLKNLDVSNFDTSQVTDMEGTFRGCTGLTSLDLSSFNTSQVTTMEWMFSRSNNLTTIYVGSGWKEASSNYGMFSGCGTDHVTLKQ